MKPSKTPQNISFLKAVSDRQENQSFCWAWCRIGLRPFVVMTEA